MTFTDAQNRHPELWEVEHSKAVFRHSLIVAAIPLILLCAHLLTLVALTETPQSRRSDAIDQFLPGFNAVLAFFLAATFVYYGRRAIAAWMHMRQMIRCAQV